MFPHRIQTKKLSFRLLFYFLFFYVFNLLLFNSVFHSFFFPLAILFHSLFRSLDFPFHSSFPFTFFLINVSPHVNVFIFSLFILVSFLMQKSRLESYGKIYFSSMKLNKFLFRFIMKLENAILGSISSWHMIILYWISKYSKRFVG